MLSFNDIFKSKKKVLFVAAHPDDIDVFFAGSIALLRKNNSDCFFLILSSGGKGGKNADEMVLTEKREKEQLSSLSFVDVPKRNVEFAHFEDGYVENNHETISTIVKTIRKCKPDIVCSFDPRTLIIKDTGLNRIIMHRDHRNSGQAVIDAVYPYARVDTYYPEYGRSFKVKEMLLADPLEQNAAIDITKVVETKKKMLLAHASQFTKKEVELILSDDKKDGTFLEKYLYFKLGW